MAFEDFKVDGDQDIILLDSGRFDVVIERERVAQACAQRLRTHTNEWLFDISAGLNYAGEIFARDPNYNLIRARVAVQLRKVPGVSSVEKITLDHDLTTRRLTITFYVRSIYGNVTGEI